MNIMQGLQLQGLTLNTQENFNSIPGLFLEMNGQERKQNKIVDGVEMLSTWSSKKEPFYQFAGNNNYSSGFKRINSINTDKGVKTVSYQVDPVSGSMRYGGGMTKANLTDDLLFLKNGAWGIYSVSRHWKSTVAGGENNSTTVVEFGSFAAGNSQFALYNTCNGTQGGIRVTYSNSGTTANNTTTVLANNDNPMNQINSLAFVYKGSGVTDNYNLKINNVQKIAATHNINMTLPVNNLRIGFLQNTRDATVEVMLLLVYNFNGMSSTVIDQYDARIRQQLEQYKLTL